MSVNESPDMTMANRTLNVDLIKKLSVGSDNPITGMAKYKDPKLFNPQMLLAFFAQDAPEFPKKDGGLRSRLSYLLMPFEFVDVCTRPHHRPMDIDVKLNTVPRPTKVTEDTAAQYMASLCGAAGDSRQEGGRH